MYTASFGALLHNYMSLNWRKQGINFYPITSCLHSGISLLRQIVPQLKDMNLMVSHKILPNVPKKFWVMLYNLPLPIHQGPQSDTHSMHRGVEPYSGRVYDNTHMKGCEG